MVYNILFTFTTLIAVRAHYTMDILGGLIISIMMFRIFDMEVKYRDGWFICLEKRERRWRYIDEDENDNNDTRTRDGDLDGEEQLIVNPDHIVQYKYQTTFLSSLP